MATCNPRKITSLKAVNHFWICKQKYVSFSFALTWTSGLRPCKTLSISRRQTVLVPIPRSIQFTFISRDFRIPFSDNTDKHGLFCKKQDGNSTFHSLSLAISQVFRISFIRIMKGKHRKKVLSAKETQQIIIFTPRFLNFFLNFKVFIETFIIGLLHLLKANNFSQLKQVLEFIAEAKTLIIRS